MKPPTQRLWISYYIYIYIYITFIKTLKEIILYVYEHFMGDDILTRNNLPVAKMLTMMHAVNANGKRTH